MTYAIIEDGGRQLQVVEGQEIDIDYRDVRSGEEVKFDRVLAYRSDDDFKIGRPTLESATVTAEVLGVGQGSKISVQKFRRRKTYRRKIGHRQLYTRVKVSKIEVP